MWLSLTRRCCRKWSGLKVAKRNTRVKRLNHSLCFEGKDKTSRIIQCKTKHFSWSELTSFSFKSGELTEHSHNIHVIFMKLKVNWDPVRHFLKTYRLCCKPPCFLTSRFQVWHNYVGISLVISQMSASQGYVWIIVFQVCLAVMSTQG